MNKTRRVAIVTEGIHPNVLGGIQVHSEQLATYLYKQGIKVDIYTTWNQNVSRVDDSSLFKSGNIIILNSKRDISFYGDYLVKVFLFSCQAKDLIRQKGKEYYDCVVAQGYMGLALSFDINIRKRLILHMHGLNMLQSNFTGRDHLRNLYFAIPAKIMINRVHFHIALGSKFKQILNDLSKQTKDISIIKNALTDDWSLPYMRGNNSNQLKLVFIGRNDPVKGLDIIIGAVNSLYMSGLKIELQIIGPIEVDRTVESSCVNYVGELTSLDNVQEILLGADALVMASYSEGMPLVILEAMSCSCAIISTNVGSISDVVDESIGWLYDKPNEELLKQKIILAYEDRHKLERRKKASWERFRSNYLWSQVGGSYLELFDRVNSNVVEKI